MGMIAQSLVATLRDQAQDLARVAEQFTDGLPKDMPSPEDLAEEGYDPQHILYIAIQNFASLFAEAACELDDFESYAAAIEKAEEEYMPSAPPMSPVTQSFFSTWALFDLRFGADQETVGRCLLEVMRSVEAPDEMLNALRNYNDSRMGIYEHLGKRAGKIRLRELATGSELLCHSASGYCGKKKELWYVRLCPPLNDEFDYHIAVTTPYVLTEASAEDWTAFLNKHLIGAEDKRQALHELLKYGNEHIDWMEYVLQGYRNYQYDAIFLTGIPDVAVSLPHSPVHDETEDETNGSDDADEFVRVKLTEAQRKMIAEMHPELSSRLKLSEKNQRTIELRTDELDRIVAAAETALETAKGPRRTTLKKIVGLSNPTPRYRATPLVTKTATIYQFKISLAGSKPPVWRRIQVEDGTLADLHVAIQAAMGWTDSHLHEFEIDGERYATPAPFDMGPDLETIDATTVQLSKLIGGRKKFRCRYVYDFGDNWEHKIELEEIGAAKANLTYPRCTGGARACPPEDCGGIWGFYDFVQAMSDRKHPEHFDMKERYGGSFKPDTFDKQKATREMQRWMS